MPTRRTFLAGLAGATCASVSASIRSGIFPPDRPNIILFLVESLGWSDTSVAFGSAPSFLNRRYLTPHIDRLAKEGLIFTNAYANSLPSPSIASIMTGMNAGRHRIVGERGEMLPGTSHLQSPAWAEKGLPTDGSATLLSETMQRAGYTTHFTSAQANDPRGNGFEAATIFSGAQAEDQVRAHYDHLDASLPAEKPFFMCRIPWAASAKTGDARFMGAYTTLSHQYEGGPAEQRHASIITGIDAQLGEILAWISRRNASRKTIILFTSASGSLALGDRIGRANFPFSAGKGSLREGGIRVPLIAWCPELITSGTRNEIPVASDDLFPTIAELANIIRPTLRQPLDGRSFATILKGRNPIGGRLRPLFWHQPCAWAPAADAPLYRPASAIRVGDFKLVYHHTDQRRELFDLSKDPGERNNIAAAEPMRLRELTLQMTRRLKEMKAQMPRLTATGSLVPYPDGTPAGDF